MPVITIVGAQWGDEGKGRVVDALGKRVDLLVHYAGGANLVQSIVADGEWLMFKLVPATALRRGSTCLLGQGMAIDPRVLVEEIGRLRAVDAMQGPLFVCQRAHVVLPHHALVDELRAEPEGASGTPRTGIGPCYADKIARRGVTFGDLVDGRSLRTKIEASMEASAPIVRAMGGTLPELSPIVDAYAAAGEALSDSVVDGSKSVLRFAREGRQVVLEGLLGTMVDLDHGHYPYVVGASTVAAGAPSGAGIPPQLIDRVVGVAKAYSTRTGPGPFPIELGGAFAEHLVRQGHEVGASSSKARRCGMFSAPEVRYAASVNGFRTLVLTKLDVLSGLAEIPVCVGYELDGEVLDEPPFEGASRAKPRLEMLPGWSEPLGECRTWDELPANAQRYVRRIEELTGVRVVSIGVGSDPSQAITIEDLLGSPT